jgi:hypothetical protein
MIGGDAFLGRQGGCFYSSYRDIAEVSRRDPARVCYIPIA